MAILTTKTDTGWDIVVTRGFDHFRILSVTHDLLELTRASFSLLDDSHSDRPSIDMLKSALNGLSEHLYEHDDDRIKLIVTIERDGTDRYGERVYIYDTKNYERFIFGKLYFYENWPILVPSYSVWCYSLRNDSLYGVYYLKTIVDRLVESRDKWLL